MDWIGRIQMLALHVAGIGLCIFLWWAAGWWLLGPWLALGIVSLVVYINTWTDKPAIWWWPYLIMCWPIIWSGGLVHPLR
jgi:hypothetical protein